MASKHAGGGKGDFPQKTLVSLIFAFSTPRQDFSNIEKNVKDSNYLEENDSFIACNSRHFDHLEDLYLNHEKIYAFKKDFDSTNEEDIITSGFLFEKKLKNISKKQYRIIFFDTGIIFFIIKLKIMHLSNYEEYFSRLWDIKTFYKRSYIKEYIKEILGVSPSDLIPFDNTQANEKIDDKEVDNEKIMDNNCIRHKHETPGNEMRFQIFSEIMLTPAGEATSPTLSGRDYNIIANYFLNRNSIGKYPPSSIPENINNVSGFYGNKIYCTEEGLLSLTIKGLDNEELISSMYEQKNEPFIQNLFFSYILVLHQYFYLHHLKKKTQELNLEDKNIRKELADIDFQFATFQTNFLYKKVSQFYYQEKIYQLIYSSLSIDSFVKEISDSLLPLENYLEKKRDKKLDKIVKFFTIITIANAVFSLICAIVVSIENKEMPKLAIALPITLAVCCLFFLLIISTEHVRSNDQFKKKKSSRVDKNKK